MTSDDTPLVIERGNELPARNKHRIIIIGYVMRVDSERPSGQTYKYSPPTACHIFDIVTVKRSQLAPRARLLCCKGVRTRILPSYNGIFVINHPGGVWWGERRGELID